MLIISYLQTLFHKTLHRKLKIEQHEPDRCSKSLIVETRTKFWYNLTNNKKNLTPVWWSRIKQMSSSYHQNFNFISPVFSGVRFTRSLVICVCFVDRCLSFCPFSFGHCVVCPSTYGFCLISPNSSFTPHDIAAKMEYQ